MAETLELVGLTQYRSRLARKYSLGMKQRLGLASAPMGRPPILLLDEPTNGLDPVGIHEIRTLIRSSRKSMTVPSWYPPICFWRWELMADDIGIPNHGRLLFEGDLKELRQKADFEGYPPII